MTNTQSTAAESVSRTVWMLGQLRGFSTKQELAKAMNWERTRLSRTLSGARQWTLEDLVEVAEVLGLSGPGDLFRPLSELVGAVQPAAAAASVRRGDRALYRASIDATIIPFPRSRVQGGVRFRRSRATHGRTPSVDTVQLGRSHRLIGTSVTPVTSVTAAVGS